MTEKLDFSGFAAAPERTSVPKPPRAKPAVGKARKRPAAAKHRRKQRVNVSLDPSISLSAAEQAEHRGMTLSDLLRAAYRDHHDGLESSWFEAKPGPFDHRSPTTSGRIVHMLYLTEDEVRILDELADVHSTSRSGVVAAFLAH